MKNNSEIQLKLGDLFDDDKPFVNLKRLTYEELANNLRKLPFKEMHEADLHKAKGVPTPTVENANNTDHDGDTTENGLSWTVNEGKGKFIGDKRLMNNEYKDPLYELKSEAIYALNRLSKRVNRLLSQSDKTKHSITLTPETKDRGDTNLTVLDDNFIVDFEALEESPHTLVVFKEKVQPLFYAVLNRVIEKESCFIDWHEFPVITKSAIRDWQYKNIYSPDYSFVIWKLNMFANLINSTLFDSSLHFQIKDFTVFPRIELTVKNEVVLGLIHQDLFIQQSLDRIDDEQSLFGRMISSGVLKSSAIEQAFTTGFSLLPDGGTIQSNVLSGLVHGKNIIEYAISVFGARLGLEFKEKGIPIAGGKMRSGYTNSYSQLDRDLHDCGADGIKVTLTKQNVHRFHGRFYIDETSGKRELKKIDLDDPTSYTLNQTYQIKSPIKCRAKNIKVCKTCWHEPDKSESVRFIGLEAISKVIEKIVQSMLSTHHTSGAFHKNINSRLIELTKKSIPYESEEFKLSFVNPLSEKELDEFITLWKSEYNEGDLSVTKLDNGKLEFKPHSSPIADDATATYNKIVSIIDRNVKVDDEDWIEPEEALQSLWSSVKDNRYSVFTELIVSSMYFDEDGYLSRETGKPAVEKVGMGNILAKIDPFSTLSHNFSKTSLSNAQLRNLGINDKKSERTKGIDYKKSPYKDVIHPYEVLYGLTYGEFKFNIKEQ